MNVTDELRRLLDERWVEHDDFLDVTCWNGSDGVSYTASEIYTRGNKKPSTRRLMLRRTVTPEQAIAATLGAGTCKVDVLNTGGCAGYECSEYIMHCNGCGHEFGHVLYNEDGDVWMSEKPSYCPNCGRRVAAE